jgi:hypothetical protein
MNHHSDFQVCLKAICEYMQFNKHCQGTHLCVLLLFAAPEDHDRPLLLGGCNAALKLGAQRQNSAPRRLLALPVLFEDNNLFKPPPAARKQAI